MNRFPKNMLLVLPLLALAGVVARAADEPTTAPAHPPTPAQLAMENKGIDFLLAHQDSNGAWLPQFGPAVTAMVVRGLYQSGRPLDDPALKKGLDFIETCKQNDGGYYKDANPNYNSSIVLSMFSVFPREKYKSQVEGLQKFLKSTQQIEEKTDSKGNKITKDNPWYGGSGYGEDRPDLSNTAFMVEALHDSGISGTDPAMQKALVFISRTQMNGATNDQAFAKGVTNGGFVYTPVEGGDSKFGDIDKMDATGSTLRSYGSMTYSGFKSLLFAGLTADDPRVVACVKWIQDNWTLEYNPGSSSFDGQFYFLHAFAKAMRAWGHDEITDSKGVKHDWRAELVAYLAKNQQADGSWINPKSARWLEGNPTLVTSYMVLSLQEARK